MILRLAEPKDAAQIAEFYIDIRQDTVPIVHSLTETEVWIRKSRVQRGSSWVLELDGLVIGWLDVLGTDVDQLYLRRGYQGKGYGKLLLDHAKTLSPSRLELFTFQVNVGARRFYAREGFREVSWGNGSDNEENAPDVKLVWDARFFGMPHFS